MKCVYALLPSVLLDRVHSDVHCQSSVISAHKNALLPSQLVATLKGRKITLGFLLPRFSHCQGDGDGLTLISEVLAAIIITLK